MQVKRSLHRRITVGFATFVTLVIVVYTAIVLVVTEKQEEALIDHIVSQEMDYLVDQFRVHPQVQPPRTQNIYGYIVRNAGEAMSVPEAMRDLPVGVHEVYSDDVELHVVVRELGAARFFLTYDVTHHEERIKQSRMRLLAVIGVILLLSLWLAYFLTGKLITQVTDLARRVGGLQPGQASTLAEQYADEEVVQLAAAFDGYLGKLHELIGREKDFTADVSHELRTPLTSIRTSGELLLQDGALQGASRERIERILRSVDRMTELVQSMLYLARDEGEAKREAVSLRQAVDTVLESFHEMVSHKPITVANRVDPAVTVCLHRQALLLVLSNLIKNALNYTEQGRIVIGYRDGVLQIIDSGRGIDDEDMPNIFQRFYRGGTGEKTSGFGLGLAIVKRLCEQQGWRISVDSQSGRGTAVSIRLSADDRASQ